MTRSGNPATTPVIQPHPRIDLLVSSVGSWSTVRVHQPFEALRQLGWDAQIHEPTLLALEPGKTIEDVARRHGYSQQDLLSTNGITEASQLCRGGVLKAPLDLNRSIRPGSLVIWQRPVPVSWDAWIQIVQLIRQRQSLLLVEWDDHPALFPDAVQAQMRACGFAQLRMAHALQCSCPRLARALAKFHPHVLVLENGVSPIPSLNLEKHRQRGPLRVFLGNLNRFQEHRRLVPGLRCWLQNDPSVRLVCVGPTGIGSALPAERLEQHDILNYPKYRALLASCQLALLPLEQGEAQACKTPIKWLEAAAESTVVVAGPELYGPWLDHSRYGVWAESVEHVVTLAQSLANQPQQRQQLARAAHHQARTHELRHQVVWREELYRHLWRLRPSLDHQLTQRWPYLNR